MRYLIKVTNFILLWCIVSTFVIGVFTIPVHAAGKKCHCKVEGCKVCGNCSGKTCSTISVRYRKKDGSTSSKHPYEKGACCKKHPKLAKQGITSMTYRYANGSWEHAYTVLFADDSSIGYNTKAKKYILYSNGGTNAESSLAGQYAKKHKLNLYSPDDKSTQVVNGKSGSSDKDLGAVFGDSSADKRYKSSTYYDCFIPYNHTPEELDAKCTGRTDAIKVKSGSSYYKSYDDLGTISVSNNVKTVKVDNAKASYDKKFGTVVNSEGSTSGKHTLNAYTKNEAWSYDSKYGVDTVTVSGVTYVAMVAQVGWFANSAADISKQTTKKGRLEGVLFDIILKDGTQIHCMTCDTTDSHCWGASDANKAWQDDVNMHRTGDGGQYSKWFYAVPAYVASLGHGSTKTFSKAVGLSKSNPISVIRIWNDNYFRNNKKHEVNSGMEGAVTKNKAPVNDGNIYGASSSPSADGSGADATSSSDSQYAKGFYSEDMLSSYTKLVEPELTDQVANSDKSVLTQEETEGLSDWQMNVERSKEHKGIATLINYVLTVIGVLLIIWGSIFYMAYWFDMINPFVDLDLVSRLSFGRFTASHELDGSCTWSLTKHKEGRGTHQQTINSKVALFISVCAIAIGVLIISGGLYRIVRSVFYGGAVLFHQMFG